MKELIAVKNEGIGGAEVKTVNARDMHSFLAVKKDFSTWIKKQIERARLVENRDFVINTVPPFGGVEGNQGVTNPDARRHNRQCRRGSVPAQPAGAANHDPGRDCLAGRGWD